MEALRSGEISCSSDLARMSTCLSAKCLITLAPWLDLGGTDKEELSLSSGFLPDSSILWEKDKPSHCRDKGDGRQTDGRDVLTPRQQRLHVRMCSYTRTTYPSDMEIINRF